MVSLVCICGKNCCLRHYFLDVRFSNVLPMQFCLFSTLPSVLVKYLLVGSLLRTHFSFHCSDGSFLNDSFILNEINVTREERVVSGSDSFSHACATSYRFCTELVHLFRDFGFFESFVHHVIAP